MGRLRSKMVESVEQKKAKQVEKSLILLSLSTSKKKKGLHAATN